MGIFIELAATDFDVMLTHITSKSVLQTNLLASEILFRGRPTNSIHCSEPDAIKLLQIARTHCHDAINGVRQGLVDAGLTVH